jgi:hypothetical protein
VAFSLSHLGQLEGHPGDIVEGHHNHSVPSASLPGRRPATRSDSP